MATTIDTSTSTQATAGVPVTDRCQNGMLWTVLWNGNASTSNAWEFWRSADDGATWTQDATTLGFAGTAATNNPEASLFIDVDDFAHFVYVDLNNSAVFYRRGTPNAGRTAWTWSAATSVYSVAVDQYRMPKIVAHREGTGWRAHVVLAWINNGGATSYVIYVPITVASGGGITVGSSVTLDSLASGSFAMIPDIDFRHTGDSKTVQTAPNLYVAWTHNSAATGLKFKKATYSGGSWTWGTLRTIATGGYAGGSAWVQCRYDGTRVTFPGFLNAASNYLLVMHERDEGDSTTTARVLASGVTPTDTRAARVGSASYDTEGNVFFVGVGDASSLVGYQIWNRAAGTLGARVSTGVANAVNVRAKRGYSGNRIEWVQSAGTSGATVSFDSYRLNLAPYAPPLVTPVGSTVIDFAATNRFDWDYSDPDPGDSQSKFDLDYRLVGAGSWTTVTSVTPNTYYDVVSGTFTAGDYEWRVRTYDAVGLVGPYSASGFFTAAAAPAPPTITAPINGATIPTASTLLEWSVTGQDAYQARTVADLAGSPDTGNVYYDSGEVATSGARSRTLTFPTNSRWEHLQVRIKSGGLWSAWASIRVQVSYTAPAVPSVTNTVFQDDGRDAGLRYTVTNPSPGVGEPAVTHNEVYRRRLLFDKNGAFVGYDPTEGGEDGQRIAPLVLNGAYHDDYAVGSSRVYEVRARAFGDNDTSSFGTWTA